MKTIISIILFLTLNLVYGQDTLRFRVTTPKVIGRKMTELRTIVHSGKLDFDFYKKHFFVPYYYPNRMVDKRYKNDTIIVWNNLTNAGDIRTNWSHTIIYDSQSKVTSYRYSSCIICSQLPYDYHFFYNQLGQVIKMANKLNNDDVIEFKYDSKGNIINVKVYQFSELYKEIELML